jgi:menaquinone-dependent protoporphyrinogen oxidase
LKPVLVLYATREGHTRKIAEHIAATLAGRGQAAEIRDARAPGDFFFLRRYSTAILAASVHLGKHEPEMVEFARRHHVELREMQAAFISVSMSQAAAEDVCRSPDARARSATDVRQMIDRFLDDTGWRPRHVKAVAGALLYRRYGLLVRFVMKRIARRSGAPTDTSRDHVLTDWKALDRFIGEVSEVTAGEAHLVS